jgi:hypothetical protein
MKKIILGLTILVFAGARVQTAAAGDRKWATAGKILTGVAAAAIITHAIDYRPAYYSTPYYAPPPTVYYAPPPVVYASAPRAVFCPPPVCSCPAPVVSFSFGTEGYYPHHHYNGGHYCWQLHHRVCR